MTPAIHFRINLLGQCVSRTFEESVSKLWEGLDALLGGIEPKILPSLVTEGYPDTSTTPLQQSSLAPSVVLVSDDCKKLDKVVARKMGPVCKSPDMRPKVIPPYLYGYCKEKDPELPMSCPPKIKKRGKGPCCHDENVKTTTGGCKVNQ